MCLSGPIVLRGSGLMREANSDLWFSTEILVFSFSSSLSPHQEFDKKYNPTWHCIVGRNFGSYVTHETKHFIYFYLGQVAILLFKSG
ncbi:dynein light chain cytoplasmic [Lynx pardinus]|uniref:Dynein light chain n=1 Tax=Lynx pardinus TaxID=191816 RepID=A0A485N9T6_LYNPA|nr:dynein light chain cytoplasmic [Lynx pardinus]